ncbi:vanadium-dependent haloperoxidase [Roseomonas sp. WA12]
MTAVLRPGNHGRRGLLLGGAAGLLAGCVPAGTEAPRLASASVAAAPLPALDGLVARWMLLADEVAEIPQSAAWPRAHTIALATMAMHDALNAIEPRYARWAPATRSEPRPAGASPAVALSMAALAALSRSDPSGAVRARAELLMTEVLATEPSDAARSAALALGSEIGAAAADRAGPPPEKRGFNTSTAQGRWRPTPPRPINSLFYLDRPILFPARDSLQCPPPPELHSASYRTDLEEVRALGGAISWQRTPEQTDAARFWVPQSPQRNMMRILLRRLAAEPPSGGLWDEARMVSILAVAFSDNDVMVYAEKSRHAFWRPVTAINLGSPSIRPDPGWETLLPTPAHPDYPSGHSADMAAGAAVIAGLLGDGPVAYQVADREGQPVRNFPSLAAASDECSESRIWAGAHFRTATQEGQRLGQAVAARALQQVPGRG